MHSVFQRLLLIGFVFGLATDLHAQQVETVRASDEFGQPLVTHFNRKAYEGNSQTWGIVQDQRGVIYIGNEAGVIEYDGVNWDVIPVSNKATVRSLALGYDGRVYVGGRDEVGFLAPDSLGTQQYVSLLDHLGEEDRDFGTVWFTHAVGEAIFFHTLSGLYRWQNGSFRVWRPETRFYTSFIVEEVLYVHQQATGLMHMEADSLQLMPGGEQFASDWVYVILPYDETTLLVGTRGRGLFLYEGGQFEPFKTEADAFLYDSNLYYPGAVLSDGTFALGTNLGGVVVIDKAGRWRKHIGRAEGLPDNAIHYLLSDREGGLWLTLDNGIARVELPSPVSFYDESKGIEGSVLDVHRHQGVLYAATHRGIDYLDAQSSMFKPVNGVTEQGWLFLSMGPSLLAATSGGIYQVEGEQALPVRTSVDMDYRAFTLYRSRSDSNLVYVGLRDGLAMLRYEPGSPGKWADAGLVAGIDNQVNTILEDDEGVVWLSTEDGVMRLFFSEGLNQMPVIERLERTSGLPEGGVWGYQVSDHMVFTTSEGLFRYDEASSSFVTDITYPGLPLEDAVSFVSFSEDQNKNIWITSKDGAAQAQREGDGYRLNRIPFHRFADRTTVFSYPDADQVVWFGGSDGLVRFDPGVEKGYDTPYHTLIRRVTVGADSVIFGGTVGEQMAGGASSLQELVYKNNAIRFDVVAPVFDAATAVAYQTMLEGFEQDWTAWDKASWTTYTNLSEGTYHFRVRAKNVYEHVSEEAVFSFTVLPPWYRTLWAYGLYACLFIGIIGATGRFQRARLIKKERALAELEHTRLRAEAAELQAKAAEAQAQALAADAKVLQAENERKQLEVENARKLEVHNIELQQALQNLTETQGQLIHAEKMASLGQLTAGIAHEIKNPLNFINNFAELNKDLADELEEAIDGDLNEEDINMVLGDLRENASRIAKHGKRIDSIVRSMMQHARGGSGEREKIDINALVEDYVNLAYIGMRAGEPGFDVTIVRDYDENLVPIQGMTQDLGRVFLNLLSNAFDAVREGGAQASMVKVSTGQMSDGIEIRVSNNGPAVPRHVRGKIFEPFFTTKPTGKGTGLGLSLSYEIITQGHGGTLSLESTASADTVFVVTLPLNRD